MIKLVLMFWLQLGKLALISAVCLGFLVGGCFRLVCAVIVVLRLALVSVCVWVVLVDGFSGGWAWLM